MPFARCLVTLNNDTLQPVDQVTNTWHFQTPGAVADAGTAILDNIDAFYSAISTYLSINLTGTGEIDLYDLEDPEPRAPVFNGSFTAGVGTNALPNEVAVALSYQAPIVSGTNQARRRGRLFIGPLATNVMATGTGDQRVASGFRNALVAAAEALMDDTTLPGLVWSVFSPTTAGAPPWSAATLGDSFFTVTNGWVNDAFDTMRSRGAAPTTRTVFPV